MDGIINMRANGYSIVKDNNCAGAQYESNSMKLRIEFSEDWDGFAKTITFWNALGLDPVKRTLTTDLLEDASKSTLIYLVPIPGEALTEAGMFPFAIDGYINGVRKRTVEEKLKVLPSRITDKADEPQVPTPDQVEQLQVQIDGISDIIQNAAMSAGNAAVYAADSNQSALMAEAYASTASECASAASDEAVRAVSSAQSAEKYASYAHEAVGKTNFIGENGNWFAWDSETNSFYDTKVRAQSGSVVYHGDNPPDEADVWVDSNGEAEVYIKAKDIPSIMNGYVYDKNYVHTDNNFTNVLKTKLEYELSTKEDLNYIYERIDNILINVTNTGDITISAYPQVIYSMASEDINSVNINFLPYDAQSDNEIPTYYFSINTFKDSNGNVIPSLTFTNVIKWAAPPVMKADTHYEIAIRGNCGVIAEFNEVSE